MARYVATVESPRGREEVFDYLAAFENVSEWDPSIISSNRMDAGEVGVGSKFEIVFKAMGRETTLCYEVTEFSRPNRFVICASGSFYIAEDTVTVDAAGSGSTATYDADLRLKGPLKLLDPLAGIGLTKASRKAEKGLQ